jgi:biopolymer transport protein ExbD
MNIIRIISISAAFAVFFILIGFIFFRPATPMRLTAALSKKEETKPAPLALGLPKDKDEDTTHYTGPGITLLLYKENQVYYYTDASLGFGKPITLTQLRSILQAKKKSADSSSFAVVIKPCKSSSYKCVVDVLDEMVLNDIKKYKMVDPGEKESQWAENIQ